METSESVGIPSNPPTIESVFDAVLPYGVTILYMALLIGAAELNERRKDRKRNRK